MWCFVTVPFEGHYNVWRRFLRRHPDLSCRWILVGWSDSTLRPEHEHELKHVTWLRASFPQPGSDPMDWSPDRVAATLPLLLDNLRQDPPSVLVYDYFAYEAALAARLLHVPSVTSVSGFYAPRPAPVKHREIFRELWHRLCGPREACPPTLWCVSDGPLVVDEQSLWLWGWAPDPAVVPGVEAWCVPYPYQPAADPQSLPPQTSVRRIYVSLGTVVMGYLWDLNPSVPAMVQRLLHTLASLDPTQYEVIWVSFGRRLDVGPGTIEYEYVDQPTLLRSAHLFVTHGGNNSLQEALCAGVPLLCFPFFGDQLDVGNAIAEHNWGWNWPVAHRSASGCKLRELDPVEFSTQVKRWSAQRLDPKPGLPPNWLKTEPEWQEGDILLGCNDDRKSWTDSTGLFRFQPFADLNLSHPLPRALDLYHDSLVHPSQNEPSQLFQDVLTRYRTFLDERHVVPTKHTCDFSPVCCAGLQFVLTQTDYRVHVVVGCYQPLLNRVTRDELLTLEVTPHDLRRVHYYRKIGTFLVPRPPLSEAEERERATTDLHFAHQRWQETMKVWQKQLNQELGWIFEWHSRIKDQPKTPDWIGFRVTSPWSRRVNALVDWFYRQTEPGLQWTERREELQGRVSYLLGHVQGRRWSFPVEVQFWPTVLYHAFEFEHNRVYKPLWPHHGDSLIPAELRLQDAIDQHSDSSKILYCS